MYSSIFTLAFPPPRFMTIFRRQLPLLDWEEAGSVFLAVVRTSVFASQQRTVPSVDECSRSECSLLLSHPSSLQQGTWHVGASCGGEFLPAQISFFPLLIQKSSFHEGSVSCGSDEVSLAHRVRHVTQPWAVLPSSPQMVGAGMDPRAKKSQSEHPQESGITVQYSSH